MGSALEDIREEGTSATLNRENDKLGPTGHKAGRFMTPRLRFLLTAALLYLALFPGCALPVPRASLRASLIGSPWILEFMEVSGVPIFGLDSNQVVFIKFDEGGKLHGDSFCNRYDAWYELSGYNTIQIDFLATTIMGCMPSIFMQDEEEYYKALLLIDGYYIDGHMLQLYNADNLVLTYRLDEKWAANREGAG